MATRSRITQSSSSVPVSILVSVSWFPLFLFSRHRVRIFDAPRNDGLVLKLSTHGRNSCSQVQALRGCCSTFQCSAQSRPDRASSPACRQFRTRRAADAAVDDEMRNVDALRRQFARHALGQPRSANLPIANGADCG